MDNLRVADIDLPDNNMIKDVTEIPIKSPINTDRKLIDLNAINIENSP